MMSTYSPSTNQDARTHAEHECEVRYLKRLVERKLKEMMFSTEQSAPAPQTLATGKGSLASEQLMAGS